MRFGFLFVLAAVLATTGCASTSQGAKEDFAFAPNGSTGLVVLSTRLIDDCGADLPWVVRNAAMNLGYSETTGKEHGFWILWNPLIKKDFEKPDGYFYIRELPSGKYALSFVDRGYPESPGAFLDKPVFFEVKAGATRYLGELTVHINGCSPDVLGHFQATTKVLDQRVRDKKLFDARMKKLSSASFEYAFISK